MKCISLTGSTSFSSKQMLSTSEYFLWLTLTLQNGKETGTNQDSVCMKDVRSKSSCFYIMTQTSVILTLLCFCPFIWGKLSFAAHTFTTHARCQCSLNSDIVEKDVSVWWYAQVRTLSSWRKQRGRMIHFLWIGSFELIFVKNRLKNWKML